MHQYELKETLLTIDGVSKAYGKNEVLRGVTSTVRNVVRPGFTQGQVVGLLGPSGVGKSTLLRIIAGLEKPDHGQVLIGADQKPTLRGEVGVVAQNYPLFEERTVMDNLVLGAIQGGAKGAAAKDKANQVLERFNLAHRADAYPAQLSGGQRQRAAIAQQILCSSHLLILDEPFSGLDPLMKDTACSLITELAASDELMSLMVITHDIREAIKVSDELWLMGRDYGADGKPKPGAFIKTVYDLKEMGLAWHPDLTHTREFMDFERKIRDEFKSL